MLCLFSLEVFPSPHPSKLLSSLTFHSLLQTSATTGYITFSTHALENQLLDTTESGYPYEQQYIQQLCKNKEHYLFWLLLHEFTHLFVGCNNDRHDEEFFAFVVEKAQENMYLFEQGKQGEGEEEGERDREREGEKEIGATPKGREKKMVVK